MIRNEYTRVERYIIIVGALLFASFVIFNVSSYSSSGVMLLTILLFLLFFIKNKWHFPFFIKDFQASMLIFAIYCLLSSFWARSNVDATNSAITVIEILLCMTVVYYAFYQFDDIEPLLMSLIWGGYIIAIYYLFSYGGISTAIDNASQGIREGVDFANINTIARAMAVVIVANFYMLRNSKRKIRYIGIFLPIVALLATQSRAPLIETIFGIIFLMFLNAAKNKRVFNFIFSLIIIIIIIFLISKLIQRVSIFNGVLLRMEGLISLFSQDSRIIDSSVEFRQKLIDLGANLFKANPIFGVGMGNAHRYVLEYYGSDYYLHNNYIELLASGGIIGFIIYYQMHFRLLINLKKYSEVPDDYNMFCFTMMLMLLIADYGGVLYYNKEFYFYIIICYICLEKSKNRYYADLEQRVDE